MALTNERIDFLNVSIDGSLPEIIQYTKFVIVLFILSYLMFQKKRKKFICWFVLFFVMLLDDAFSLHESSGKYLAITLDIQPFMGLRSVDYGELLYAFAAGIIILPLMSYCYIFGDKTFKKSFLDLSLLLIVLLFFGIFIDMLHSYFSDIYPLGGIFGLLEDGGEMIALSLIAWYLLFIAISTNNRQVYLHSPLLGMQK
ncbi:hypothetical protein [Ulvibacterium marinum]|uniref:hypothetical protein n=1 Tax=Ulvibacterium marinum TaxID=2419782 RepID=UPI002493ECC4|nr:hypothetical protein [Ulvibacterium marinum]